MYRRADVGRAAVGSGDFAVFDLESEFGGEGDLGAFAARSISAEIV